VYDIATGKKHQNLEVIPIDINENCTLDPDEKFYTTLPELQKAIADGRFPSPPARNLYFLSNGKPKNLAVIKFLNWAMNEGQKYVTEAGFVPVSPDIIEKEKQKLN
jgi:phosphate transport system substrate-binding protein